MPELEDDSEYGLAPADEPPLDRTPAGFGDAFSSHGFGETSSQTPRLLPSRSRMPRPAVEAPKAKAESAASPFQFESRTVSKPEKRGFSSGVLGGLGIMAVAAVWFFVGLQNNYIFFYPPVLFVAGLIGFVKGLIDGNLAGD
ncbi:MAG: hypothetical protein IAF94_05925 [Pirellulaceae bacterium]|nr:hypothetical protein [Pirellulaceae bacterium]